MLILVLATANIVLTYIWRQIFLPKFHYHILIDTMLKKLQSVREFSVYEQTCGLIGVNNI